MQPCSLKVTFSVTSMIGMHFLLFVAFMYIMQTIWPPGLLCELHVIVL